MSDHVFEATDDNFEKTVVGSDIPVIVDFWAPWCGPCKQIAPILHALADQYGGKVKIAKINVDNHKRVASTFGIQSIPTLIAFRGGEMVGRMVGFQGKAGIQKFVDQAMG